MNRVVGTPVLRVEDLPLLRGDSSFVANRQLEGCVVAHYVCSTYAHADITGIDVSRARSAPGVLDVVTATELAEAGLGPFLPGRLPGLPPGYGRPALAGDRARFVGEPVAVIVAETAAQAADAAEEVVVAYEPLPVVVGVEAALHGQTWLFPEAETNVMVAAAGANDESPDFSDCDVVADLATINNRVAPCPIETRVAAAYWDEDGRLVQYASCQGVHPIRAGLAAFYGLEPGQVRVIGADVGGSFGSKGGLSPEEILLGFLARRTGRAVLWAPNRSADMVGLVHSRGQLQRIKVGGRKDGTIEAIEAEIVGDCGAYPLGAPNLMRNAGLVLPGPFKVPAVRWTGSTVVTNTTPLGGYRGAGRPEGGAMLNRGIDAFAREAGLDPLDVMRTNLIRPEDMPWTSPNGLTYDSGNYGEALELAVREVGHDDIRARQLIEQQDGATVRTGIGWAGFIDRTAGLPGDDWGAAELRPDGTLLLQTSSSPYGQGHYTAWAMLASERTGIPIERIAVFHGDTDVIPKGPVTAGSRSAQRAGVAVAKATDELVELAKLRAADLLEAAAGDVRLDPERGAFYVAGTPSGASASWVDVATAVADGPDTTESPTLNLRCESDSVHDGPSVPFGFYAAVVAVDIETGEVKLERIVSVDDAGTVLNPLLVEGQLHGGIAQGIGQAMFEEFVYDAEGNPLTSTFLDYCIPAATEMPNFEIHVVSYPSPTNPLGVKGIGESGAIGAVPAIQNAVIDALADLGVRHVDMPLTPQRVWTALRESSSK